MRMGVYIIVFLLSAGTCYGQDDLKFGDTGTTNKASKYKPNAKMHKKRRMIQWVKSDAAGLLQGNRCMDEITNDMGFVYVVQPKGQVGNRSEFGRLAHNFFAKIGITFRNGPFWKFKLKKKRRECRRSTGDFVG
ncbi:hypothetical protein JMN32_17050 [Fulvivirga sp. 29W222]|uniref:Uncharacterized protein n=1 Tax=Fulvivirga marina TaxID=2494733 RepID=A0A937G0V0_9BACT|nr:hypothetical protein [Fulvivirga marina]MBL6448028.1 hypothetical protein [Fulvivirga marina]